MKYFANDKIVECHYHDGKVIEVKTVNGTHKKSELLKNSGVVGKKWGF